MFAMTYNVNKYKAQKVETSKQQLVVMCYDGMIIFMKKVEQAIQENKIEQKMSFINKTIAIIEELQASLNFEKGGEIAVNLERIYNYFLRELMFIGRENDLKKVHHITKLMKELQSAWVKVANEPQTPAAQPSTQGISYTG